MKGVLYCVLFVLATVVYGQTVTYDTIVEVHEVEEGVYETVYYVKKHVQINQEYLQVDTVRGEQWAIDIYAGVPLTSSLPRYGANDLTLSTDKTNGYFLGGSLYYNVSEKWSLRAGACISSKKVSGNYRRTISDMVDVTVEVQDTLDTYFTINGADTSFFHIIETATEVQTIDSISFSNEENVWRLSYVQVPIQICYGFEKNRWRADFLAGINLNVLMYFNKIQTGSNHENISSFYGSGLVSCQVGYFAGNSMIINVEPRFEVSLRNRINSILPARQFSVSFGIKQFF